MAEPRQDWKFGHIYTPDEAWLATAADEAVLEPDLPIVDPHHHLWQRGDHGYFLNELLADLNTGHNIVATVFLECRSMYRAGGPVEMRPVGETEFVAGIAAMSASGKLRSDPRRGRYRRLCRSDPRRCGRTHPVGASAGRLRPLPRGAPFRRLG